MVFRNLASVVFTVLCIAAETVGEAQSAQLIKGRVVTGTNRFLEQPLTDFGALLGTAGFSNVAEYNPYGAEPVPLTTDTPLSALLATYVDPSFLILIDKTPADVDPAKLNVLLQDVPVNVDLAGINRSRLEGILQSNQLQPGLAEPSTPITLADWMQADGMALIKCDTAETSSISITLKRFLPNRLYTIWSIFGQDQLIPLPLGGVPNAVVTDSNGNAKFDRLLNFCPFQMGPDHTPLLLIDVVYHSDHQIYGTVPDLPFADLFTGTVNHTQYEFQIMGLAL